MDKFLQFLAKLTNGEIIEVDKMLHFTFSYIFAHITSLFISEWYVILSFVLGINLMKELIDSKTPYKKFDYKDIIAGFIGGILFILTFLI